MKSENSLILLLRLLDHYGGEHSILGDMFKIIGKENTMKLLNYFKGEVVKFPGSELVDDKLKVIEGYISYKVQGNSWEDTIRLIYGGDIPPFKRKYLRNGIRDISGRVKKFNIPMTITREDLEDFRKIYYGGANLEDSDKNV